MSLSAREKEIVTLLARGLTSKEIADKLCISKSTVESHRKNLRDKTGAKTTSELIAMAVKHSGI